jgi:hypothetical protein
LRPSGPRQLDPARAARQIALVLLADAFDVPDERSLHRGREHRDPILAALPVADRDLVHSEIDVFDAQSTALEKAQSGAVEQKRHQTGNAVKRGGVPGRVEIRMAHSSGW